MRNAFLFCLPSWYEALGCVYLEAMASGVPTIGCYDNGIDEIIKDSVNGYLVHGRSHHEIYDKMMLLLEGNNYSIISENARRTIEDHYTWSDSARRLKHIYTHVMRNIHGN